MSTQFEVPADEALTLKSDTWNVGIFPDAGASILWGNVHREGTWHQVLRPTPEGSYRDVGASASYPLIPWSNRIEGGVLRFNGRTWQLTRTAGDGTALHGAAMHQRWDVVSATDSEVVLRLDTRERVGVNFPWHFTAELTYRVVDNRLEVETSVTNVDAEAFPVGLGHHPYFLRQLDRILPDDDASSEPALLRVPAAKSYRLDRCLARGEAEEVEPRVDFRELRGLGEVHIDDCLTGLSGAPYLIRYPNVAGSGEALSLEISYDPIYTHAVVFVPQGQTYFAAEPVTNANDAFALREAGVQGEGTIVLAPGASVQANFAIASV